MNKDEDEELFKLIKDQLKDYENTNYDDDDELGVNLADEGLSGHSRAGQGSAPLIKEREKNPRMANYDSYKKMTFSERRLEITQIIQIIRLRLDKKNLEVIDDKSNIADDIEIIKNHLLAMESFMPKMKMVSRERCLSYCKMIKREIYRRLNKTHNLNTYWQDE
mgnify:CR=1 FL=1